MSENFKRVQIKSDGDGHNFVVPLELADEFSEILERCSEIDDYDEFEKKFGKYATGGCVNLVELYIKENK